jgi:hypothetical protein
MLDPSPVISDPNIKKINQMRRKEEKKKRRKEENKKIGK